MGETLWLHYYCLKLIFLQAEIHHARVFSYFRGGTKFVRPLALEGAKEPSLLCFLVGFGGTSSQVGRFWVQTPPRPKCRVSPWLQQRSYGTSVRWF